VVEIVVTPDGSTGAGTGDAGASPDGSMPGTGDDGSNGSDAPGTGTAPDGAPLSCDGGDLHCRADPCPVGSPTSLSGTVYDPAGLHPLPHVFVFVPADPQGSLPAITPGTSSCNTCDKSIGPYVAATRTDATGSFSLKGVPTGHMPLVFQIGKWRREVFVDTASCADTHLADPQLTRLPKKRAEGDMPQIALLTGGLDDLGCFLRLVGIDASEYAAPHAGGRVDVYQGGGLASTGGPALTTGTAGDCTTSSCPLWASRQSLEAYDVAVLACEGAENLQTKSAASIQAMHDWLGEGGRVLATHFHYTWFKDGPPDFQAVATWLGTSVAASSGSETLNTAFPKGRDFYDALQDAGVLSGGQLPLTGVGTSVSNVDAGALWWVEDPSTSNAKVLSFTTPVARQPCGKALFTDAHAGGAPSGSVPGSCTSTVMTAAERALELLFFDLTSCVSDDALAAPAPPPSAP
jgi:hypothetical protein